MEAFFVARMKQVNVAVGIIIGDNGKILLTQRYSPESPEVHLKWQLPGGGVEKGETIESACVREVLEETGLNVRVTATSQKPIPHVYSSTCYNLYGCKIEVISGTINVEKDIETNDARWFEYSEIKSLSTQDDTIELIEYWIK